jgi:uncharacterized membrane protein YdbT with pleckstrin-like domain
MNTLREQMPLRKIKIFKKTIRSTIKNVFASLFFLFFFGSIWVSPSPQSKYFLIPTLIVVLFIILSPIILFIYNKIYLNKYFYDMNEKYFIIKKGVVSIKEITLPFSKITDVYIDQDIFDRIFKLYDFHISTPTAESVKFAHVDGLSKEDSERMKNMVLEKIIKNDI